MNKNDNVVNEIQMVKEEIIDEIIKNLSTGREELNIKQLKTQMLIRISYILEENNMSEQEKLVLDIVDNETQAFFKEINDSFDRKENCVVGTLNNELSQVQQEYSLDEKYDLSQGLNKSLNMTLNNYYDIKDEENKSIQKEIMNRGLDSYKSVVYEKIRSKLQELGIYNENSIDDITCQIDSKVKADIESAYDGYLSIDSNFSKYIESICVEKIRDLDNQLEMRKEENAKSDKEDDSKFTAELKSLTISLDEFPVNDSCSGDSSKKNKGEKSCEKPPLDDNVLF